VDDARLVVLNAVDAAERGATVRVHTQCVRADRADEWILVLNTRGRRIVATARVLVNTTGPWTAQFSASVLGSKEKSPVRLVKGSHIVVPRMFDHGRSYLFQNNDGRVIFAIPFHRDFTLIGTTDTDFDGDPGALAATDADIGYLCNAVNEYFRQAISPDDVVWAFAGVRSLYDDGRSRAQDVTRDHVLNIEAGNRRAPLVTLYGGKLTTYRRVAEDAIDKVARFVAPGPAWTASAPLPGGDLGNRSFGAFAAETHARWPFLGPAHAARLAAAYGSRVGRVLRDARRYADLGPLLGADLTGAEVRYLMRHEWAETPDDVLWRRTKLGLRFSPEQREALAQFMAGATGAP
jgi:glycerol-3-phosphate dehydrogenase